MDGIILDVGLTVLAVEVPERQALQQLPISCNVNFQPKFLEQSRWYLLCLSIWCPHFSLYRNKKDITEFSKVSCYSIYEYFGDNNYTFVKKSQEFGRHFPIHFCGDIFNFGSATAPACVQPEKLLTLLSSLCPLTFQRSCLFRFLNIHISAFRAFAYIQLEKLFSYEK